MNKASAQLAVAEGGHQTSHPTFREAFRFWLKLGFVSFGGPTGQIAMMHTEVVEKKKWVGERHFLHALNFCMLLPGPEAQQLAIYIGWLLHKTRGGIVAGALFVIPSIFILWTLSYIYVAYGHVPSIAAISSTLRHSQSPRPAHTDRPYALPGLQSAPRSQSAQRHALSSSCMSSAAASPCPRAANPRATIAG